MVEEQRTYLQSCHFQTKSEEAVAGLSSASFSFDGPSLADGGFSGLMFVARDLLYMKGFLST